MSRLMIQTTFHVSSYVVTWLSVTTLYLQQAKGVQNDDLQSILNYLCGIPEVNGIQQNLWKALN